MKTLFMYNPVSGKGKILKKIKYIKNELEKVFDLVEIYETRSALDTIEKAKAVCGEYDVLVFSGGDGTFNDVACGIASCDERPILGYIPSGTVNDIARNLKISKNIKKAVKVITEKNIINHDVGMINDKYFIYVVGMGTFTEVSYRTKQKTKRILGKLAYFFDGFKDFFSPKLSKVIIKGKDVDFEGVVPMVLVLNSVSAGGINFNMRGHLNDGVFDILAIKNGFFKGMLNLVKTIIFAFRKKKQNSYVSYFSSPEFEIICDKDITWCVDGEEGPKGNVKIKNLHSHLKIYAPKLKRDKEWELLQENIKD